MRAFGTSGRWIPVAAVMATAALALAGCSASDSTPAANSTPPAAHEGHQELASTEQGYTVPQPLKPGPRGELIASADHGSDSTLSDAHRTAVLYHSQNSLGQDVAVSGVVLVPSGAAPNGGWPVISWAHGTVGLADRCAPSLRPNLGYDEYADEVRYFLDSGYAVAATDYIGLGTPGTHTYMNQVDQGRAVSDIVTAARTLDSSLSDSWYAVGHSQGGAAVLTATRSADGGLPEGLKATVAVAPGNNLGAAAVNVARGKDTTPVRQVYMMFLLAGADASGPAGPVSQVLTDSGKQAMKNYSESVCAFDDPATAPPLDARQDYLTDSPELTALSPDLDRYGNPDTAKVNGAVSVLTGTEDKDVPPAGTVAMVDSLNRQGSTVALATLPGRDHDAALIDSHCQQLAFLAEHGGPTAGPQAKCPR